MEEVISDILIIPLLNDNEVLVPQFEKHVPNKLIFKLRLIH